ncbi:heterokaryon incompatibility protein-domain-containing protein [Halenospora varia]|nr:heterokaryon incompatibility protein-domain-containing protein [Halenospora varia]
MSMSVCKHCRELGKIRYHYESFSLLRESARTCCMCKIIVESFYSVPETKRNIQRIVNDPDDRTKLVLEGIEKKEGFTLFKMEIDTRRRSLRGSILLSSPKPYCDRPIWTNTQPVTFEDSFVVLKSWLAECHSTTHKGCEDHIEKQLPTRLLKVKGDRIRLVETSGWKGQYAALSHCWGSASGILCTTRDTFAQYQNSIIQEQLPRSFQDAVEITRKLELDYLWIDSLCIIQGDEEDWEAESSKMADVFGNSHITIAATAARNSKEGFLFNRDPARDVSELLSKKEHTYHARVPSMELASLQSSPLYKRGWVLQEMVLSKRVVHFARDQLFWNCRSSMKSEDGFLNQSYGFTFFDLDSKESSRRSWWSWIEDYSNRKLTKPSDKCAALAGLTTAFHEATKMTAKAGLWEEDIYFGLLWCSGKKTEDSDVLSSAHSNGPSWSWLSVDQPIRAITQRDGGPPSRRWKDHNEHTTKTANITSITVEWSDRELISELLSGRIEIRARLKQVLACPLSTAPKMEWQPEFRLPHLASFSTVYVFYPKWKGIYANPFLLEKPSIGVGVFDSNEGHAPTISVFCLELSIYGPCYGIREGVCRRDDHCIRDVLLVRSKAGGQSNEYERIGVGYITANLGHNRAIHPREDYFSDTEPQDLILV